jgi:hypothetical protein
MNGASTKVRIVRAALLAVLSNINKRRALRRRIAPVLVAGAVAATALPATASAACTARQLVGNSGFETGLAAPWTQTSGVIRRETMVTTANGLYYARLVNNGDTLSQAVTLPSDCTTYSFSYKLKVFDTFSTSQVYDKLIVTATDSTGKAWTLSAANNLTETGLYFKTQSASLVGLRGQPLTIKFTTTQNATYPTSFVVDDVNIYVS